MKPMKKSTYEEYERQSEADRKEWDLRAKDPMRAVRQHEEAKASQEAEAAKKRENL